MQLTLAPRLLSWSSHSTLARQRPLVTQGILTLRSKIAMRTLLIIVALAGAIGLSGTAVEQWAGSNLAVAQSRSSACFQNCTSVRYWPANQCLEYCKGRTKRKAKAN
jgi:hypothetical protein